MSKIKIGQSSSRLIPSESNNELYAATLALADEAGLYDDAFSEMVGLFLLGKKPSWVGGMRDITTGNKFVAHSQMKLPPLEMIPAECLDMCKPFGGFGAKYMLSNGRQYTVGNCWEFKAYVNLKILNPSLRPDQVRFTESFRPRMIDTFEGPCEICQSMFGRDALILPNPHKR